jgi:hypothetical protein
MRDRASGSEEPGRLRRADPLHEPGRLKRPRLYRGDHNDLREERSGTDIAGPEYIGQRRGQKEGNQNPGDEEI